MGTPEDVAAEKYFTPPQYHWTYQCHRCFIKSGSSYTGDEAGAYDNAPTCCSGEAMHPVRGNEILRGT